MIKTGIQNLDKTLGGGIHNGIITDIFGASGIGKSQLVIQISVNCLVDGGRIFFQDTTGSFRPERMLEFITAKNKDSSLMEKVTVVRARNTSDQVKFVEKINKDNGISLIVIDNVTDLFSFEYSTESEYLKKHRSFMKYMHSLALTAINKKIPVIVTNIIRNSGNDEKENLERSINMFTHMKIHLSKMNTKHVAQVLSPFSSNEKTLYVIRKEGLFDFT